MGTRDDFLKREKLELLQEAFEKELQEIKFKKNAFKNAVDKQESAGELLPWLENLGAIIIEDLQISKIILADSQKAIKFSEPLFEWLKIKVEEILDKSDNIVHLFDNLADFQKVSEDLSTLGNSIRNIDRVELIEKHVNDRLDLFKGFSSSNAN